MTSIATTTLRDTLRSYVSALGAVSADEPLFRAFSWSRRPTVLPRRLSHQSAYGIVRHWAAMSGVAASHSEEPKRISNHTFRATGITTYLDSGGSLERAQRLANHASMRTTQLYDRRNDAIDREEVEKLQI
jgi:integrase